MGNFYLANKQGGRKFIDVNEESLEMYTSQAAAAITKRPPPLRRAASQDEPGGHSRDAANWRRLQRGDGAAGYGP